MTEPAPLLSERLAGRENNIGALRLLAAFLVLFGHSFTLLLASEGKPYPPDPISRVVRAVLPFEEGLPGVGVHVFFFISGLLVTRSFLDRGGDLGRFVRARALRIVPAYWANLFILALVMGPLATHVPLADYFRDPALWRFLACDLFFWPMSGALPGVFETLPVAGAVNGPYWTLPLEVQMYSWCLLLGWLGLYHRRWCFALFLIAIVLNYLWYSESFIFLTDKGVPRLWHFFFFGTLACLYADRIRLSWPLLALTFLPLPALYFGDMGYYFHLAASLWFCYALLFLGYRRHVRAIDPAPLGDFSYGIYLYAFPVQQCLVEAFGNHLSGWGMVAASTAITLPIAYASWRWIEKPALRFKKAVPSPPGR